MANTFIVRKDQTIDVMEDATDADIREMYESLSAVVIFRVLSGSVQYAEPNPGIEGIIWKKAQKV